MQNGDARFRARYKFTNITHLYEYHSGAQDCARTQRASVLLRATSQRDAYSHIHTGRERDMSAPLIIVVVSRVEVLVEELDEPREGLWTDGRHHVDGLDKGTRTR